MHLVSGNEKNLKYVVKYYAPPPPPATTKFKKAIFSVMVTFIQGQKVIDFGIT